MAEVSAAGHVLEKTTRTRIIPDNIRSQATAPEFWDYISRQRLPDPDHLLYVYLQRDNRNIPYGTYTSHFPLRDGKLVPIDDQEAMEAAIQARFGGGIWRLILKSGRQRICETRIFTGDGPTLPPPTDAGELQAMRNAGNGSNGNAFMHQGENGTAQIASKAIDVLAGQEHQAVNLGLGMMTTAADVMKRFAERTNAEGVPGAPAAGPEVDLRNALTQALVARLAMDPMQQFAQMAAFLRELNNGNSNGGGGGVGRQMEDFRSMLGFARELLGGSAGPSPASTGAAIVNVLPGIVSAGVDIARAWQVGKEAERDAVALATHQPAGRPMPAAGHGAPNVLVHSPFNPPPRPVLPPRPPVEDRNTNPAPMSPAPAAGAGNIIPPSTEFIEAKIVELLRLPIPAEESASRALEFLYTLSGPNPAVSYVTQLTVLGETGLVNLFHMRPTLKPATEDMARLLEFIRSFLKFAAEEEAERARNGPKPN